jgi:hypothetical protein
MTRGLSEAQTQQVHPEERVDVRIGRALLDGPHRDDRSRIGGLTVRCERRGDQLDKPAAALDIKADCEPELRVGRIAGRDPEQRCRSQRFGRTGMPFDGFG